MINAMDLHKAGQRVKGLGDGVGGEEKGSGRRGKASFA